MVRSSRESRRRGRFSGLLMMVVVTTCASPESEPAGLATSAEDTRLEASAPAGEPAVVTILTTNGADFLGGQEAPLQGEWSFAAWVEVGERAFLFDTGWSRKGKTLHSSTAPPTPAHGPE